MAAEEKNKNETSDFLKQIKDISSGLKSLSGISKKQSKNIKKSLGLVGKAIEEMPTGKDTKVSIAGMEDLGKGIASLSDVSKKGAKQSKKNLKIIGDAFGDFTKKLDGKSVAKAINGFDEFGTGILKFSKVGFRQRKRIVKSLEDIGGAVKDFGGSPSMTKAFKATGVQFDGIVKNIEKLSKIGRKRKGIVKTLKSIGGAFGVAITGMSLKGTDKDSKLEAKEKRKEDKKAKADGEKREDKRFDMLTGAIKGIGRRGEDDKGGGGIFSALGGLASGAITGLVGLISTALPFILAAAPVIAAGAVIGGLIYAVMKPEILRDFFETDKRQHEASAKTQDTINKSRATTTKTGDFEDTTMRTKGGKMLMKNTETGKLEEFTDEEWKAVKAKGDGSEYNYDPVKETFKGGTSLTFAEGEDVDALRGGNLSLEEAQAVVDKSKLSKEDRAWAKLLTTIVGQDRNFRNEYNDNILGTEMSAIEWNAVGEDWAATFAGIGREIEMSLRAGHITKAQANKLYNMSPLITKDEDDYAHFQQPWMLFESRGELNFPDGTVLEGVGDRIAGPNKMPYMKDEQGKLAANDEPIKLAKGGLVRGPIRSLIGEAGPELVLPLQQAPKFIADVLTKATNTLSNQQVGMQNILSNLSGNSPSGASPAPVVVNTNTVMNKQSNAYHSTNSAVRDVNGIQYKMRNSSL